LQKSLFPVRFYRFTLPQGAFFKTTSFEDQNNLFSISKQAFLKLKTSLIQKRANCAAFSVLFEAHLKGV
jgi:hypothetical protein